MATQPIVDLSKIDLQQVAANAQRVGEINPQCGDMRQLDHVIWMANDATCGVGVKYIRDDEFWVSGHLPGRPLMPGVLMIEAAAQLCSIYYRHRAGEDRFVGFTRCDETVFRGQVVPGDTLYLLATELRFSPRRLESHTQGVVDGKLIFESKIVGMVV